MLKEYTIDQIPYSHVYGRTVKGTPLPLFWTASGLELNHLRPQGRLHEP